MSDHNESWFIHRTVGIGSVGKATAPNAVVSGRSLYPGEGPIEVVRKPRNSWETLPDEELEFLVLAVANHVDEGEATTVATKRLYDELDAEHSRRSDARRRSEHLERLARWSYGRSAEKICSGQDWHERSDEYRARWRADLAKEIDREEQS